MTGHQFGYAKLDQPGVLQVIFHPREEYDSQPPPSALDYDIVVEENVRVGARFHMAGPGDPNILFFHGNGEIASDYVDIGPIYNQIGVNLFVADYRGYGWSGGKPTLTSMIKDAHPIFKGFRQVLMEKGFSENLFIMGRSLGSASAIELTYHYQGELSGLIVESGFANIFNLFEYLGFPAQAFGITMAKMPSSMELIRKISIPTLVIHGEYDQIVPVDEGKALYNNIAAKDKGLLIIPGVDHNTILLGGMQQYFRAIQEFVSAHS